MYDNVYLSSMWKLWKEHHRNVNVEIKSFDIMHWETSVGITSYPQNGYAVIIAEDYLKHAQQGWACCACLR